MKMEGVGGWGYCRISVNGRLMAGTDSEGRRACFAAVFSPVYSVGDFVAPGIWMIFVILGVAVRIGAGSHNFARQFSALMFSTPGVGRDARIFQ